MLAPQKSESDDASLTLLSVATAAYQAFDQLDRLFNRGSKNDSAFEESRRIAADELAKLSVEYSSVASQFVRLFSDEDLRQKTLSYWFNEQNASAETMAEITATQNLALEHSKRSLAEANLLIDTAALCAWPSVAPELWRTLLDLPAATLHATNRETRIKAFDQHNLVVQTLKTIDAEFHDPQERDRRRETFLNDVRVLLLRLRWSILAAPIYALRKRGEKLLRDGRVVVLPLEMIGDGNDAKHSSN